jgi:hypothetical protein
MTTTQATTATSAGRRMASRVAEGEGKREPCLFDTGDGKHDTGQSASVP